MNAPLTFLTHLECSVCRDRHSPHEIQSVCRSCGKSLIARYDLQGARSQFRREHLKEKASSMWRYLPVLPIEREVNIISLGEGMTPIIPLRTISGELGIQDLWMKDEGQLPTGSFKARGLAMAISKAKEVGVKAICMPTAGNAGGAAAAYAARAGLKSYIFMPEDTPEINIKESIACGARVELVKGNISDAAKAMNEKKQKGWFDVSTLKEPYRLEGKKTMGYELAEQLDWQLPDVIFYPTGGGTGLIGMWKAFDEMEQLGWLEKKRPRMVSVQTEGCAPIVKAFTEQKSESEFWQNAQTVASGLRVPKAFADHLILKAVYDSNGAAVAVSDEEVLGAMREIAQKEGLFICPEGAATLVALKKLTAENFVKPDDSVLLFNTGAGIKYPDLVKGVQ